MFSFCGAHTGSLTAISRLICSRADKACAPLSPTTADRAARETYALGRAVARGCTARTSAQTLLQTVRPQRWDAPLSLRTVSRLSRRSLSRSRSHTHPALTHSSLSALRWPKQDTQQPSGHREHLPSSFMPMLQQAWPLGHARYNGNLGGITAHLHPSGFCITASNSRRWAESAVNRVTDDVRTWQVRRKTCDRAVRW